MVRPCSLVSKSYAIPLHVPGGVFAIMTLDAAQGLCAAIPGPISLWHVSPFHREFETSQPVLARRRFTGDMGHRQICCVIVAGYFRNSLILGRQIAKMDRCDRPARCDRARPGGI